MSPKVSVVMIAYSAPEYIAEAVDSIICQDFEDFEIIVVDDGSPHDIQSELAPFKDRVKYVRQENQGPGIARDTGARIATGEYIAFADTDDVHLPYRLAAQSAILDAYPKAAFTFGDCSSYSSGEIVQCSSMRRPHQFVEELIQTSSIRKRNLGVEERSLCEALQAELGKPTTAEALKLRVPDALSQSHIFSGFAPALLAGRHIAWGGSSMYRASVMKKQGEHHPRLRYWEDWHYTAKMAKQHEFAYWDAPIHWYRQHESQITKQSAALNARSYRDAAFDVWKDDKSLQEDRPELYLKIMKKATLLNATYATENKEYKRARKDLFQYIRMAPFESRHAYSGLARNLVKQVFLDRF